MLTGLELRLALRASVPDTCPAANGAVYKFFLLDPGTVSQCHIRAGADSVGCLVQRVAAKGGFGLVKYVKPQFSTLEMTQLERMFRPEYGSSEEKVR